MTARHFSGRIRVALSGQRADPEERLSYKAEDATDRRGSTIAVLASAGKTRAQKEEEALE
jgi:hypothetical protein